ncbi:hypothetical protein AQEC111735_09095 [Aquirufa ecclesiirivi]
MVPVKGLPFTCGPDKLTANLLKVAALTATLKLSPPVELIDPSVTETVADSTLYNDIGTEDASPFVNVITVAVPKLMAAAFLSVTVGFVAGLVETLAPEKVKDLSPV